MMADMEIQCSTLNSDCKAILTRMDNRLDDVQKSQAEMRIIYESHSKRIERIEHELFGNGRSGLAVQVRAILWISSTAVGFLLFLAAKALASWLGHG